jgi:glycerol uptake facilitator protein
MVAAAFALVIAAVIFAFGTTSGAHINPAVTIALAARGRFPPREVVPYLGAQLAGAITGALFILALYGSHAADLGTGGTVLAPGASILRGIVVETCGTFLLVTAVFALAVDRRAPVGWAAPGIGLAVACAILVTGPVTGGSLNPARTFGPLLVTALWHGPAEWRDLPAYLIGPVLGGLIAAFAYDAIARPGAPDVVAAAREQGTAGEITGRRE